MGQDNKAMDNASRRKQTSTTVDTQGSSSSSSNTNDHSTAVERLRLPLEPTRSIEMKHDIRVLEENKHADVGNRINTKGKEKEMAGKSTAAK